VGERPYDFRVISITTQVPTKFKEINDLVMDFEVTSEHNGYIEKEKGPGEIRGVPKDGGPASVCLAALPL
jgi:hypothetical protein